MESPSWKQARALRGHTAYVWGLSFNRKGELLAAASAVATARLWQVTSGKEVRLFKPGRYGVLATALTPDEKVLAMASWEGVKLWDTADAALFRFGMGSDSEQDQPGGEVRL